ncbi:MAG TPA: zf-HC2 domain-containing protein [Acidobacteriaceae bacterium]|nr:zf-HC2 domain-containing protein [Acidobacteriaceae bacterium]
MSEHLADSPHLSGAMLSALVDGELAGEEMVRVEAHLAECAECTRRALSESLLKRGVARAGQRYAMPEGLRERVMGAVAESRVATPTSQNRDVGHPAPPPKQSLDGAPGRSRNAWILGTAAAVVVCVSAFVARDMSLSGAAQTALVNEAVDEHIAAMAAGGPEVVSSDRHTVKPWFQGKLPFSFNLPQELPADVTLDGANLVQVEGQPAAQLLFSIGKHKASVFVRQRSGKAASDAERNGFHVEGFHTRELDMAAVSDADLARLRELVKTMEQAQQ